MNWKPIVLILFGILALSSCGDSGDEPDTSAATTADDDELISPPVPTTGTYLTSCDDSDNCFMIQKEDNDERILLSEENLQSLELVILDSESQVISGEYYQVYLEAKTSETGASWTNIYLVSVGLSDDISLDSLLLGYDGQIVGTRSDPGDEGFTLSHSFEAPEQAQMYSSPDNSVSTEESALDQYVDANFKPLAGPPKKRPPPPMRPPRRR